MSLSQPTPPNPFTQSSIQQQFNGQQMVNNALINDVQQQTPYGSETYQYAETPSGIPEITATQALNAPQSNLLNTYMGTQQNLANTGNQLSNNIAASGTYNQPPNLMSTSSPQVQQMMSAFNTYMSPFWNIQNSNSDSSLQNQGLGVGSTAYNNAKMGLNLTQNQEEASALAQFEPQAFNQALTQYNLPLQTASGLMGAGTPAQLNQSFYAQPQSGTSQPPNYQQASQQQFQNQQNQFQNTIGDIGSVAGALTGSGGLLGPLISGAGSGIAGLFGGLGGGLTSNDSRIFG